jgi:hypothetical protein
MQNATSPLTDTSVGRRYDAAGVLAAATEAGESADALFAHAVAQLATFVGFEPQGPGQAAPGPYVS